MEHVPALLFVKDERFRIVAANQQFLALYPEDMRQHVLGTTTVESYPEEQRELFLIQDRIALEQGFTETTETIDFPNGKKRILLTRKVGHDGADGSRYVLGIATDVTDLEHARHVLRDKNEELTEFAYRTSHDLRAPVVSATAIIGLAQELIAEGKIEEAQEALGRAQRSLGSVVDLTEEITRLTKLDSVTRESEEIDFTQLFEDTLERLSTQPGFDQVKLEFHETFQGRIVCDLVRLRGIVENLVSNAIRYRDPDAAPSRVWVKTLEGSDGQFVLECRDNGLGVPEDYRERLFGMFRRFHPQISEGSGLGLYMVKRSAERMGGSVAYEPGTPGSTFSVTLPRTAP